MTKLTEREVIEVVLSDEEYVLVRKELQKTIKNISKPQGYSYRRDFPDNWKFSNEILDKLKKKRKSAYTPCPPLFNLGGIF